MARTVLMRSSQLPMPVATPASSDSTAPAIGICPTRPAAASVAAPTALACRIGSAPAGGQRPAAVRPIARPRPVRR
ncbi:hypothetical protein [Streptomyces sp. x-80]|uniref:hypothetical protein n=1 Tax=Streptomyces sp. x-80 TaxID=2789282 RepID=UPI003980FE5C